MRIEYQCAPNEPDLDHQNGVISMMQMAPPTIKTVEWVAAYAETRCSHFECQVRIDQFKNGNYASSFGVYIGGFNTFEKLHMMRVKDDVLHWDWPWGRSRMEPYQKADNDGYELLRVGGDEDKDYLLLFYVLRIMRLDDSIFTMGGEVSSLPWLLPFPSFSNAPKIGTSEMPLP
jgi:hypothetical protein